LRCSRAGVGMISASGPKCEEVKQKREMYRET